MCVVGFFPSIGDENTFILTNMMDLKYDLFEIACIVRHLDTRIFRHNYEMSLKNMNDFMFRITVDNSNLSRDTFNTSRRQQAQTPVKQQQTPVKQQPQHIEAPSQEFSHYQSKHTSHNNSPHNNSPVISGRRQKFRKLFEEAIREEPELHINKTIDEHEYNYGLVPLAIDIPSFQTADGKYNENY
jgi:hypothetical protein